MSVHQKCTYAGWLYSTPFKKKMTCFSPSRRPQLQTGTNTFLMVSLQLALSPQFASLVGAGVMLLLMVKVGRFFYKLPNVSRTNQIAKSRKNGSPDYILVGHL